MSRPDAPGWSSRRWAGYGAAATAFAFAAVSIYWGLGGLWGVGTLGGDIERLARARDPVIMTLNWTAAVLKLSGGVLALALVQPWGRRLPRLPLFTVARIGAILLTGYGLVQTVSVLLVQLGVLDLANPVPPEVLWWRLLLWEPWFLVWGLLLGATAWPNSKRETGAHEEEADLPGGGV